MGLEGEGEGEGAGQGRRCGGDCRVPRVYVTDQWSRQEEEEEEEDEGGGGHCRTRGSAGPANKRMIAGFQPKNVMGVKLRGREREEEEGERGGERERPYHAEGRI